MNTTRIACTLTLALALATSLATGPTSAKQRSAKDQALFEKARKDCNGPHYPSGARAVINYGRGTYRCEEPASNRR